MKRIMIIGCSGAGKSTLSRQLYQLLGLPLISLDRGYLEQRVAGNAYGDLGTEGPWLCGPGQLDHRW